MERMEGSVHSLLREAKRAVIAAVQAGEADSYGAGDELCLATRADMAGLEQYQPMRDAWSTGLDLMAIISRERFHRACLTGNAPAVASAVTRKSSSSCVER